MATLKQMKRGLELRPTYDEVLNSYLSGGPNIKKPDRTASFIRESPQYQDLLKTDFIDLQKQQNDMLQTQRKHIVLKEQASQTGSDMKSVLASESSAVSEASQQVQSDLSALSRQDTELQFMYESYDDFLKELEEDKEYKIKVKGKQLIKERLDEVTRQHEHLGGLRDSFIAAQATGTEDFTGATGSKLLEKSIAEGQRLDQLRVLPPGLPTLPQYIAELSKNKEAIEGFRKSHGLFDPQSQAAASSSSGPVQYEIRTPRVGGRSKSVPPPSTKGTKGETNDPETNVAKRRGRPVNPDSARQKAMAKK